VGVVSAHGFSHVLRPRLFNTPLSDAGPGWNCPSFMLRECGRIDDVEGLFAPAGIRGSHCNRRRLYSSSSRTFVCSRLDCDSASQSLARLETKQTGFDLDHVTIQTSPFHLLDLKLEAMILSEALALLAAGLVLGAIVTIRFVE
jgi:hypothetical protein